MPFKSDGKSGKVGRIFPDFFLLSLEGERVKLFIRKGYLHLKCLELVQEYSKM